MSTQDPCHYILLLPSVFHPKVLDHWMNHHFPALLLSLLVILLFIPLICSFYSPTHHLYLLQSSNSVFFIYFYLIFYSIVCSLTLPPCFWNSFSFELHLVHPWLLSCFPVIWQDLRSEMRSRWLSSSCTRITDWRYWRGGGGREASVLKRRTTVPRVSWLQLPVSSPTSSLMSPVMVSLLSPVQLMADA